jgi:hypothetical protein
VLAVNPVRLCLSFLLLIVFIAPARAQKEDWQPTTQYDLEIKQVRGNPYPEVKDFFGKVQAGDEQQTVLTGGSTNAQKSN